MDFYFYRAHRFILRAAAGRDANNSELGREEEYLEMEPGEMMMMTAREIVALWMTKWGYTVDRKWNHRLRFFFVKIVYL